MEINTDERSLGLGINLWGSYAYLVGSCTYGAISLRPNFVIVADLHQCDHEEETISQRAPHPKASSGVQGFLSLLGARRGTK